VIILQYTPNYGLIKPQVSDNVNEVLTNGIGNTNTTIDTQIKSLHDEDTNLQTQINDNYTTLDTKIDTTDNITNNRIDNLILNSAPLPAVAAQEVMDAHYSPVYDETFPVLTDRITNAENKIDETQQLVGDLVNNYLAILRLGGIA
jgi:hypothetical protein